MSDVAFLVVTSLVIGVLHGAAAALLVTATIQRAKRGEPTAWPVVSAVLVLLIGTIPVPGTDLVSGMVWFFIYPLLLAIYPDGRFIPWWSAIPALAWVPLVFVYAITGAAITDAWWWLPVILVTWVVLIGCQMYRYRRRNSTLERERVRWGLLGTLIEISAFMVLLAVTAGIGEEGPASEALANLLVWPLPVGLAIGLSMPRIVPVDAALHIVVAVVLGGWILAGVFASGMAVTRTLGVTGDAAAWLSAAALAALTFPVLRGARRSADWVVYGKRTSPTVATRQLQRRLDALSPVEDISAAVEAEVLAAVGSAEVRLTPARGEGGFPVSYQGEVLARLAVAPRHAETDLTGRDRDVVVALAAQAAPALHGNRALTELTEARAALVLAREEERKRLRRDLHDDLGPTLAGLGLSLSAVRALAPDGLRPLVEDAQYGVREAIAQTRHLAHGLRPAILDDRGLADAIKERARLLEASGIRAQIVDRLPAGRALPAGVEVAALLIAQEAITNVARHSHANCCQVLLQSIDGVLELTVEDDGTGFASPGCGLGLGSMRERAAELGGRTIITDCMPHGTRINVQLPWQATL